ncbi:helix-turn-helix transcriptional regulator [Acrocarpospora catenulata]|uniref:helix-turn-helix transcriptional regulator n=1 Tax=Acrocarpospora catenulata TaxID=2836182 RepID=UPI0027DF6069|nr:helix-turn-helix domain-containing protein [Acrocarpospora catenulata]
MTNSISQQPVDVPATGRRLDVLRTLKAAAEPLSIAAIADRLGVHPNTVRFHLDTLVHRGQAEQVRPGRSRPGRPPLLFQAVGGMDPAGPRHYQVLAEILTASLATSSDPVTQAIETGRAWGHRNAARDARAGQPVERLMALLDDLDFAPEYRDTDGQIGLRHCPFLELAATREQVVCPIHLGLMRGAMEAWEAPLTVERLEAFAEPDLCLVSLAPAGGAS